MKDPNMFVTLKVSVSGKQYAYSGEYGEAELSLQVPRSLLECLDLGNLILGLLEAAIANFDAREDAEEAS